MPYLTCCTRLKETQQWKPPATYRSFWIIVSVVVLLFRISDTYYSNLAPHNVVCDPSRFSDTVARTADFAHAGLYGSSGLTAP
jgi:hypothetical protein